MTREEAIKHFKEQLDIFGGEHAEAIKVAIEALEADITKWRTWSHTYDNACIDGTLEVKVEDATKVGRVLISDDKHRGGLYYPDECEPKGEDLISRAEALMEARPEYLNPEQIGHEEYNKGWSDAISMYWANLNALPAKTQDKPTDGDLISRAEAIEHFMRLSEDESLTPYTQMLMVGVSNEIKKLPSADRPRGEWIEMGENKDGTHNIRCNQCGESFKARGHANSHNTKKKYRFCPNCGADMRSE